MWAVLPLKDFVSAKSRLSGVLSPVERRRLFHAMVEDVLSVLSDSDVIDGVLLVSDDPTAALLAEHFSVELLDEPPASGSEEYRQPLNIAVAAGCRRVVELVGETDILVLHADLPQITLSEISRLAASWSHAVSRGEKSALLVSDRHGEGSNALLFNSGDLTDDDFSALFHFGRDSYRRHHAAFSACGFSIEDFASLPLAADIDTPDDLADFLLCHSRHGGLPSRLSDYCHETAIDGRLELMWPSADDNFQSHRSADCFADILPSEREALALADDDDLPALMQRAVSLRDTVHGDRITYSKKVFIPLTRLCRDVCHYCTFATTPKRIDSPYLTVDQVLLLVRQAEQQGCREALFTLGEKPERRYRAARAALAEMGFSSTIDYVVHVAAQVAEKTSLLPHINAGCMDSEEIVALKEVSASMGIMLESSSLRLTEKGMPHYGSVDKHPALRLETIRLAGEHKVPFTSGILIGIGETRRERIESLLALRDLHQQYGHLQEIIVQNFRAKPDTKMAEAPDASLEELLWTIAVARIIFGSEMHIQAPPNLSPGELEKIVAAGIDDWGGVSPLTPDHVNPEAPWPHLDQLARQTRQAGKLLHPRLTVYPNYARGGGEWFAGDMYRKVLAAVDGEGWPREDGWVAGVSSEAPAWWQGDHSVRERSGDSVRGKDGLTEILDRAGQGESLQEDKVVRLFGARDEDFWRVCEAADQLRRDVNGDTVGYVVNRNINYTNICYFKCQFCAFSKGKMSENLRGRPYDLDHEEIQRRVAEAWRRGATEVCLQGGIHPSYNGQTYIDICHAVKAVAPDMHIHAFSPLEIWQGAKTLGLDIGEYLQRLQAAGLSTLPGTAAEILDDTVREILCAEKIRSAQWLHVMEEAHRLGIKTTATMMYGHVETPRHWARHLLQLRQLQSKTQGFSEFVPLPFVPQEAPLYLKGRARRGPTFREAVLVHAVARLVLHGQIDNIQTSWVKMGEQGVAACLQAGANDVGGTLMNETITRSAGAQHGEEMPPVTMDAMIVAGGRQPRQRLTGYGDAPAERVAASYVAAALQDTVGTAPKKQSPCGQLSRPGLDDADILLAVK